MQWQIIKNITSMIGGRLFISLSRLIISLIIVRIASPELFGAYVVVMSFLYIGEWLMDFGFTDIAVRNISQNQHKEEAILASTDFLKWFQGLFTYIILLLSAWLLDFSSEIIGSLAIGGVALLFYGFCLTFRTQFRVHLQMDKDIIAESISVILMIGLVLLVCIYKSNLLLLTLCHFTARLSYYLIALILSTSRHPTPAPKLRLIKTSTVDWSLIKQALPLGLAGVLAVCYENIAPLILAKLMSLETVAFYSIAMRFILPAVVIMQAISSVFYTLLAKLWKQDHSKFIATQQQLTEITFLLGCFIFCGIYASTDFLVSLFGSDLENTSHTLALLSWVIPAKAITLSMSLPVIICGEQKKTLYLTFIVVIANIFLLLYLIPLFGIYGAVSTYLFVEILVTAIPLIFVSQYLAKFKLNWLPVIKIFIAALLSLVIVSQLPLFGSLASGIFSVFVFTVLIFSLKILSVEKVHNIMLTVKNRNIIV